ncbi:MAG: hypothetical protein KJO36_09850 [Acidimicrobiia bacterium]|nr:hypothetical protein [Acidimicrobiia bacterium]
MATLDTRWTLSAASRLAEETGLPGSPEQFIEWIEAVDQWVDDNAASFVAALPPLVVAGTSAVQKARSLEVVLTTRYRQRIHSG